MKWGVSTLYYKSLNLGGLLQAYAVTKLLESMGYECEQICYDLSASKDKANSKKQLAERIKKITFKKVINKFKKEYEKKFGKSASGFNTEKTEKHINYFKGFREMIPHSSVVYNSDTISQANSDYDAFICGSDQVWAPNLLSHDFFTLNFVDSGKPTISVAASMGKASLTSYESKLFFEKIKKLDKISVREKTLGRYIGDELGLENQCIFDPTILIERDKWRKVADYREVPKEKYVLCYFLGNSKWQRLKALEYAKNNELKLVYLPYTSYKIKKNDLVFTDCIDVPAGPNQFIGLIEKAECVFTDSFHAMMFSVIFEKDFFVFNRDGEKGSNTGNSRIIDFLGDVDLSDRFICTPKALKANKIDYTKAGILIAEKRNDSLKWLKNAVAEAEKKYSERSENT